MDSWADAGVCHVLYLSAVTSALKADTGNWYFGYRNMNFAFSLACASSQLMHFDPTKTPFDVFIVICDFNYFCLGWPQVCKWAKPDPATYAGLHGLPPQPGLRQKQHAHWTGKLHLLRYKYKKEHENMKTWKTYKPTLILTICDMDGKLRYGLLLTECYFLHFWLTPRF